MTKNLIIKSKIKKRIIMQFNLHKASFEKGFVSLILLAFSSISFANLDDCATLKNGQVVNVPVKGQIRPQMALILEAGVDQASVRILGNSPEAGRKLVIACNKKVKASKPVTAQSNKTNESKKPKGQTKLVVNANALEFSQHVALLQVKDCLVCNELVKIPAGSFDMGSEDGESDEKPVHKVEVAAFEISRTEVTQAQWRAVMGEFQTNDAKRPVERVSWDDIQEFLIKLNKNSQGYTYRLPSEAEWEYAARAGGQGKWTYGNDESKLGEYAWYAANSQRSAQEVANKKANEWGLFDIHGNVWEWVQDCYEKNYQKGQPTNGAAHKPDDSTCKYRVVRGGSWGNIPNNLRAAYRGRDYPAFRFDDFGFRLARTVP
jgi:formylglycine-generating enzyme required for sulfatase activity